MSHGLAPRSRTMSERWGRIISVGKITFARDSGKATEGDNTAELSLESIGRQAEMRGANLNFHALLTARQ